MRILLVRPKPDKETIGLQSVMVCEPLELMTLASVLIKNNHVVEIADMILDKRSFEKVLNDFKPEIVGITGYISHINVIKKYANDVKIWSNQNSNQNNNPNISKDNNQQMNNQNQFKTSNQINNNNQNENENCKVLVGGVHAEVCPEDFKDQNIDLVCKSALDLYKYTKCEDLTDTLPLRDLPLKYRKHYYYLFHQDCALIKTSFGCPYKCNFCFCKEIAPYNAREIDKVIEELKTIEQEQVYIVDDDFLFNRSRLLEFAQKLKDNKIYKKYLVYGRADFVAQNADVLEILKNVGLQAVIVGIEAASQEELDGYNKKSDINDNINAIKVLKKLEIECYATVILGVDWDKTDFKRLYRFLVEMDIVFVNLQPFTPMPHTPYFEENKDKLLIPYDQNEKWDMAHLVIKPEKLSVREYYWQIIVLYYKITITPKHSWYMIRRYGFGITLKLSVGAMKVTWQYIKKLIRG